MGDANVLADFRAFFKQLGANEKACLIKELLSPAERQYIIDFLKSNQDDLSRTRPMPSPKQLGAKAAPPEKPKRSRPNLPPGLEWPEGDYGTSPEAKRGSGGGIIPYLERVWLPILEAGRQDGRVYVDRRIVADWYPGVLKAIENYRAPNHHGLRREIPEELRFPRESDINDLAIGNNPIEALKHDPRLARVIGSRLARGKRVPGL